jgi:gluconokinase
MANSIIFIMGVSGSGKTTVGKLVAQKIPLPFFDADDFHSEENKAKMKAGQPLTDDDRAEWLRQINQLAITQGQLNGAVIACSALKEKYRKVLETGVSKARWFFLQGNYDTIFQRLQKRQGHYMPASLLQSQFDNLEIPDTAFCIGIENEPSFIADTISKQIGSVGTG